ncbi:patatin-like phospholipase family protein [Thiosocius teredinicola]|uniref:patatin-like phospholipase family protein n=1 Tax=Thiosocius teredinicola TaxID=1973002 RepID=UPI000990DAAB
MEENTFEIGLVGAGAVSAGAYTAGVIDFFVQALDAWYAAKQAGDNTVPNHGVKLSAFSGASAGGITAALAAGYLGSSQPAMKNKDIADRHGSENKLFDAWVDKIDIEHLLKSRDIGDDSAKIVSLLDSTVLREIADVGLTVTPREQRRPYVADDFHLLLTVTNLRGVPYSIPLAGAFDSNHAMFLHADYVHVCVNDSGVIGDSDVTPLAWKDLGKNNAATDLLKTSALASGAFPIGLVPRKLSLTLNEPGKADFYSSRKWPVPLTGGGNDGDVKCISAESIPVNWGTLDSNFNYEFLCVDGGVMNNEPLELARRILSGSSGRNAREGDRAEKAVVMIDPFPSEATFRPDYDCTTPDLVKQIMALFNALKNQTRFKPDELMLAAHPRNYSRFMVAPSRDNARYPIACGALGGFGGFLKREFREHDFFLGRRNAQKFLKDHFVLLETNPLFADWADNEEMKQKYCVRDRTTGDAVMRESQRLLPIIPLVGDALEPCDLLPWPNYTKRDAEKLEDQLDDRLKVVLDGLVSQYFATNNVFFRLGAKFLASRKRRDLLKFALQTVQGEIGAMELSGN